jgi:hypothetical protein
MSVEGVNEQSADESAVLPEVAYAGITGPSEKDVADPEDLLGSALAPETMLVNVTLPGAKTGTGPRTQSAALLAVGAVERSAVDVEVKGLVRPVVIVVAQTSWGHDTTQAAQPEQSPRVTAS